MRVPLVFLSIVAASLALGAPARAAAPPTPLSSSALLLDAVSWEQGPQIVQRAAQTGGGRLQIVVTLHVHLNDQLQVTQFGLLQDRRVSWRHPKNFRPLDDQLRAELQQQLNQTIAKAVELGQDIAILPHLDAVGRLQEWRNDFQFSPLELLKGHSYASATIQPILKSLQTHATADTRVWLSLSGEMGRSLFAHPDAYRQLAGTARRQLALPRLEIGVSLNHNDLGGTHQLNDPQRRSLQTLLDELQFVGFSQYRPFEPPATAGSFRESCRSFNDQLAHHGLRLPDTAALHFSEVGLGGAPDRHGRTSPARAASQPWEGAPRGPHNPWASEPMRAFRRQYYAALLKFLSADTDLNSKPGRPAAAFLWSEGSWEPLGVDQPGFADPEIAAEIRRHNRQASAGQAAYRGLEASRP